MTSTALIARHDDDVREIRRAFDEFFPREAARGRETGHTGTFRLVRVTRSRYLWAAAAASLALILWALLSVRALTLAPLPPVARPLLLSVPDAVRAPVTSFGLAFSSFVVVPEVFGRSGSDRVIVE